MRDLNGATEIFKWNKGCQIYMEKIRGLKFFSEIRGVKFIWKKIRGLKIYSKKYKGSQNFGLFWGKHSRREFPIKNDRPLSTTLNSLSYVFTYFIFLYWNYRYISCKFKSVSLKYLLMKSSTLSTLEIDWAGKSFWNKAADLMKFSVFISTTVKHPPCSALLVLIKSVYFRPK